MLFFRIAMSSLHLHHQCTFDLSMTQACVKCSVLFKSSLRVEQMINIEQWTCLFVVLAHRVEPTRQRKELENDIDAEQSYFGVDQIENRQPSIFVTQILVSNRQMIRGDYYEMTHDEILSKIRSSRSYRWSRLETPQNDGNRRVRLL